MFLDKLQLHELRRAAQAILVVVLHTIVSGVIISCIWISERLILLLWGAQEPLVFGVQLHTIVLGAKVVVLLTFLIAAIFSAALTFWR